MKPAARIVTEDVINRLYNMNFFIAPAAIKHHGNYTGGLFDHSLAVTETLLLYTEQLELEWDRLESPYLVGMFHDLCKTDDYVRDSPFGTYFAEFPAVPNGISATGIEKRMGLANLRRAGYRCPFIEVWMNHSGSASNDDRTLSVQQNDEVYARLVNQRMWDIVVFQK